MPFPAIFPYFCAVIPRSSHTQTVPRKMSKRARYTLIGFLLFMLGMVALAVELIVGQPLLFLAWLDILGKLGAFCVKLCMIFGGIVIVTLASADENAKDEYLEN